MLLVCRTHRTVAVTARSLTCSCHTSRFVIDGGNCISQVDDPDTKMEELEFEIGDVFQLDVCMTTGSGKVGQTAKGCVRRARLLMVCASFFGVRILFVLSCHLTGTCRRGPLHRAQARRGSELPPQDEGLALRHQRSEQPVCHPSVLHPCSG